MNRATRAFGGVDIAKLEIRINVRMN